MKNKVAMAIYLITLLSMAGCATTTPKQQAKMDETVAMCFVEKECEVKWAVARKWVLNNITRKIQIYSDDLIETYNPKPQSPLLAARVVKEPNPQGGYAILANVWCDNPLGCQPKKVDAIVSFNNYVNPVIVIDDTIYEDLLKKSNYSKPLAGIYFSEINGKFIIKSVYSASPAMKAGIKPQDIIVQLKGRNISTMQDFMKLAKDVNFGDKIEIKVKRDANIVPLTLEFPTREEIQEIRKADKTNAVIPEQNDIEDKIESLNRLLKKGLITQEDYDKKKKELLEKY
jgi:hypothetical protein